MFESNKITFTLKQVTPIIHFKGEKDTLRGTDLKPRFDKFLNLVIDEKEKKDLLLKKSKDDNEQIDAFDYKIKISKIGKNLNCNQYLKNRKIIGAYFGDLGKSSKDSDKPAYELSFYKNINVEFIVNNGRLKTEIKKWFPKFMVFNTFGTRKNKGYGYFLPEKCNISISNLESIIKEISDKYCYKGKSYLGVYKIDKKCSTEKMLKFIDEFHKKLKSGYNKEPSIMFSKNNKIINEKDFMKTILKINEDYIYTKLKGKNNNFKKILNKKFKFVKKDDNKFFLRTLLGFPPFYDFNLDSKNKQENKQIDKFELKSCNKNGEIDDLFERFESPISYIPIPNEGVIILVNYKKIECFRKNRYFIFESNLFRNEDIGDNILKVPSEKEYSIWDIFKCINVKNFIVRDIEEYPYGIGEKEDKNVK
ncbi:hypothetical protein [Parvimonas micra]|uniref:hypothetical protein n=2 Tax=Parvimonas micra TaxID=33033 RepID=UPI002006AA25|nr:hypothetical protein [Parvimonas micra]MCK6130519.1 hypothetical protein [Parvimonas micra]MCK6136166.1 hypothetical protein [Parvimonas micra]MCK6137637.1 hypothetical protein [Parvimonas micra]MCK6154165.1 hypothetical protein [Parvimonas micra]WBB39054.1 hypothetical protein NM217_02795 [Parvimonas micra]